MGLDWDTGCDLPVQIKDVPSLKHYGKVGYLLDAAADVDVMVSGVSTKQDVATNTLEIGGGFNYSGIGDSTNIYLEALYITGSEYSEVSGNFGFRYAF